MQKWANAWLGGVSAWLLSSTALAHPVTGTVTDSPFTAAANFSALARQLTAQPLHFSQAVLMADTGMAWRLDLSPEAGARDELTAPTLYGPALDVQIDLVPKLGTDDQAMLSSKDLQGASSQMGLDPLSFELATDLAVAHHGPSAEVTDNPLHPSLNADGTQKSQRYVRRAPDSFDEMSGSPRAAEFDVFRVEAETKALRNEMLPWLLGIALIYAGILGGRWYVRYSTRRRWVGPKKKRSSRRRRRSSSSLTRAGSGMSDEEFSMASTMPLPLTDLEPSVSRVASSSSTSSSGSRRRSHRRRL